MGGSIVAKMGQSRSGARWGWLLTTMALGVALCIGSWANYRSVRSAVSTLQLGQVGVFEGLVMNAFRGTNPRSPSLDLDSLVAANAEAGLRFVGRFSPEEGLRVLGGTPSVDPVEPPLPGQGLDLVQVGDRIRAFVQGPRPLPGPPPMPGTPPQGRTRRDQPEPSLIVIEFEPLVAGQLMTRAIRSLVLGGLAAALLMLTAFLFWRATLRQEAEERTIEEQRRLSTLGEMSAVLAHEIRNPLASLKGHAQLLAERFDAEAPERGKVDRIVTEALRLEALTTHLLDFVRTGPLDLGHVKLEDFLRSALRDSGGADVDLDLSKAPEEWTLDAQRIRQVLSNLLDNAVEASPDGAPITVTAASEGSSLVITFRDQGEGIGEESLDQIFQPFFTTRTKGTGLGLAVARRIVELHGGTLTARSVPEGGAEFSMTLMERKN